MALKFISGDSDPSYVALSTDIVSSKIPGANLIGKKVYTTDDSMWYIIKSDLTLSPYNLPFSITGTITIGAVTQGAASPTENWGVNVRETIALTDEQLRATPVPVSSPALTDTELRATPVPVSSPALTDTELRATPVPVSATALPLPSGAATSVKQDTLIANQINGTQVAKVLFDPSNLSVLGTLEADGLTPVIQGDFVYGLNSQLWNTPVVSGTGAAVDTNASRLRVQSGTASGGFAYITSRRPVRYRAGQGTVVRFTPLFTAGAVNNIQLMGMGTISSNAIVDGFFFGFNGTSFGIAHYNSGVATWILQANWNINILSGYDPTKGSPVLIKYPYLGYGNIEFFIQDSITGRWTLVHIIQYANANTAVELSNPTLNFLVFTLNSGNTSNKTIFCGSVGAFISGVRSFVGNPKWAMNSYNSPISTVENCLINIKNATTYNGIVNRGLIRLNSITVTSTANTTLFVKFKIGVTIGGTPSYTPISGSTADGGATITNGNSIASFDIAGTTVTGGTYVFNTGVGSAGTVTLDLTPFEIFIAPSEIMTISAVAQANTNVGMSINWSEDI